MEDREIVRLYLSRNEQAISASRSKYGAFLYGIAMNILRQPEDAEECESDTYYSAWRHIPPDEPWALRSYLGKITRYLSISRYRMRHAAKRDCNMERMLDELEQCIPDSSDPQQELEAREAGKYIGAWLETQRKENRLLLFADTGMEIRWRSCQAPLECRKHGSPSGSVACGEGSRHIWSSRGCPYE